MTQGNAINDGGNGTQINGVSLVTLAFGIAVPTGDVNGDGVADVFAGAAGTPTTSGSAFLFHATEAHGVPGRPNGTIRVLDTTTTLVGAPGSSFGITIAR